MKTLKENVINQDVKRQSTQLFSQLKQLKINQFRPLIAHPVDTANF
jgi:hypothetical protein